jgi:Rhodopirellula transposase DDE domain
VSNIEVLQSQYEILRPFFNERQRRLWAATEARARGRGGISLVSQATGISPKTLRLGIREVETIVGAPRERFLRKGPATDLTEPKRALTEPVQAVLLPGRQRRPGGGCKRLTQRDPMLSSDLEAMVDPLTRGDPQSPLRWTCKSTTKLAEELRAQGHRVSPRTVASLLEELEYSLQSNRKTREGASHPDRNAQFEQINTQTRAFQERGQPVISVDTKKKELVGNFKNGGREWQPQDEPQEVATHDFPDKKLGKAIPYGIYDLTRNEGWVSVGIDHDTAEFAAQSIEAWWHRMGQEAYPEATQLLIIADGGGSNSSRTRLWKWQLQQLANRLDLSISVCHFPPGTSKWNKIEHRMFCHITENWRGRPLSSQEVIVELIGHTTTRQGLRIRAEIDRHPYPTGQEVKDEEFARIQIEPHPFHGEWNYTICPSKSSI